MRGTVRERFERRSGPQASRLGGEAVPRKTFVSTKVYSRANLSASAMYIRSVGIDFIFICATMKKE